ncbi:hypothetical protein HAX54_033198 [Datura stramonium]|uniref:Uncharacterized protein n=1 Tax=Datura stramonium TaxID=4076 RepID=A0ABS8VDA9_DATST|nr:hypothetical protein [Datura stramonium]
MSNLCHKMLASEQSLSSVNSASTASNLCRAGMNNVSTSTFGLNLSVFICLDIYCFFFSHCDLPRQLTTAQTPVLPISSACIHAQRIILFSTLGFTICKYNSQIVIHHWPQQRLHSKQGSTYRPYRIEWFRDIPHMALLDQGASRIWPLVCFSRHSLA